MFLLLSYKRNIRVYITQTDKIFINPLNDYNLHLLYLIKQLIKNILWQQQTAVSITSKTESVVECIFINSMPIIPDKSRNQ